MLKRHWLVAITAFTALGSSCNGPGVQDGTVGGRDAGAAADRVNNVEALRPVDTGVGPDQGSGGAGGSGATGGTSDSGATGGTSGTDGRPGDVAADRSSVGSTDARGPDGRSCAAGSVTAGGVCGSLCDVYCM